MSESVCMYLGTCTLVLYVILVPFVAPNRPKSSLRHFSCSCAGVVQCQAAQTNKAILKVPQRTVLMLFAKIDLYELLTCL